MVGYPFRLGSAKDELYYGAGNPMGFYSSWASFAVTHHYLIYHACRDLHIDFKTLKYCILGDDIVICDRAVSERYKELLAGLGVNYSAAKTYTSPHFMEFAKRLFYKGEEISPFPISSLNEITRKYYLFVNTLREIEVKGWVTEKGAAAAIALYYGMVLERPSRFTKRIESKSTVTDMVMRITRSTEGVGQLLTVAAKALGFDMIFSDFVTLSILSNVAVESFSKSNPTNPDPGKRESIGLGPLAIRLVELLTDDIIRDGLGFTLLYSIPHLSVYGQIEESFTKLNRQAREIDTVQQGN